MGCLELQRGQAIHEKMNYIHVRKIRKGCEDCYNIKQQTIQADKIGKEDHRRIDKGQ